MAIQRRPQICRDIPKALLLLLILRTNITESSFQNWSQFIHEGLPYSLLNGSSSHYNPVLRDGESRFVIITKEEKTITLVLHKQENNQENSSEFCICWNKTDKSVYLSNTSCVSCPLLPTCVPHFLSLVYENDQIPKTLQINGTDIAIKNASRHLTFKTEKDEGGDVYVVHDLREFDATSGRQPRPKGDSDFEGPSSGDNEVVPLSVGIAAIVSLTIILIICFKRRPCRNEAPSHALKQVDIWELGRSRSTSDVRRNEQCEDGDSEIYYEEIRTSYVPESQGLSGRPIWLQEDRSCRGISPQEDHDYAEIHTIPYEWEDSHGRNGVVSYETVNDIYESLETLRRN
ncbi:uncharacterized protein LOC135214097 isoform X2 [Macrobrachium nipponense]|uniref:uncharacterized protein LOC135214097 isoform X2 n=1 Tax=Macrobrachium nipponense TaxID=159736 RepID=UPI0030C80DF9